MRDEGSCFGHDGRRGYGLRDKSACARSTGAYNGVVVLERTI
ncbi:MAG TPA: hypothetical protein VH593_05240 [Ktedonobacteraceae bacterium]